MRTFLIALSLATLLVIGIVGGRLLQQRRQRERLAEATAKQAEEIKADLLAEATAKQDATPAARPDDEADEDDEDEEAYIREVLAKRAVDLNCQTCHEETMYTSQRLTPAQWKAEVEKMDSWGAILPDDDREPVEEYLAKHHGADAPAFTPARIALADVVSREILGDPREGTADVDPANGAQLFKIFCASCHGETALGSDLAPALANRAVLTHVDEYDKQVQFGLRKMPAMGAVLNPEQQRDILGWLRSLPYDQPLPPETPKT
jgi:mono/diheme cytochrome c family protein